MTIQEFISATNTLVLAASAEVRARNEVKRIKRTQEIAACNDDLVPNFDYNGVPHAPCDNYLYVDDSGEERVFMKGEFLPWPKFEDENWFCSSSNFNIAKGHTLSIKMTVENADILVASADDIGVAIRKSKEFDVNGVPACFVKFGHYYKTIITAIEPMVAQFELVNKKEFTDEFTAPVVEGRIEITGKVLTVKVVDNMYGRTVKMLVGDDRGFKVWGTRPDSLWQADKGARVSFTAAVTKSDKDESFGFYKRPTKAKLLTEAA